MNEENLLARRQMIFITLDKMKEENEKITAQKLAAKVNMGKQTVLPFYREWKKIESITTALDIDLSESLVHAIKKELAQEKFKLREENQILTENIDELTDIIEEKTKFFNEEKEKMQQNINDLEKKHKEILVNCENKNHEIQNYKIKSAQDLMTIASLKEKFHNFKHEKEAAFKSIEKQTNKTHQQLLEHWNQLVKYEKNEKLELEKKLKESTIKENQHHKEIFTLETKKKYLEDENNILKKKLLKIKEEREDLIKNKNQIESILQPLGDYSQLDVVIKNILIKLNEYDFLQKKIKSLEIKLKENESRYEFSLEKEKELIKLKSYIEGINMIKKTKY